MTSIGDFTSPATASEHASPAEWSFRPLTPADLPMLHAWLVRPHVAEWWDGEPSLAEVEQEYGPMAAGAGVERGFVALRGGTPVGFVQSYVPALAHAEGWWTDEHDPGVRGIDVLLAEPALLGRGHGATMVRAFVAELFRDPAVTRVQVDPSPTNPRAIRCFARAGFRAEHEVDTPDGRALLMYLDRASAGEPPRHGAGRPSHGSPRAVMLDPENPVVALCAAGMAAEGTPAEARRLFEAAWAARRDDYDASIAAHYLARHQPTAEETLRWNALAAEHAERVRDGRAEVLRASLYLNLGDALLAVGQVRDAREAAERAARALGLLPADGYRDFVAAAIERLQRRVADAARERSDERGRDRP